MLKRVVIFGTNGNLRVKQAGTTGQDTKDRKCGQPILISQSGTLILKLLNDFI
jgi:hypothetical protein